MNDGQIEQLLTFVIAGENLAMALGTVEEVLGCGRITRVPSMPRFVRGAMNLRGRALPVIDLAAKLGFAETVVTRWTCLLAIRAQIQGEPTLLGVLVDEVNQLHEVPREQLEPTPSFGTSVHPSYLRGMLHAKGKLVQVLDMARVLSTEELLLVTSPAALAGNSTR
jgi:purine-binding chemotaxis protein CheW